MGIISIIMLIIDIIGKIPQIIALIESIVEMLRKLRGEDHHVFLERFRRASTQLKVDGDTAKYQAELENMVCDMHKACYPA